MSTTLLATTASGAVFGAALTASGVYSPWIIIHQMNLSNFHMLQTFLVASGSSAIAILLSKKAGVAQCPPRSPSSLNLFPYDGNIIGGLLLGAGMALTGACPGTVLVQVATGIKSGYFALAGGIAGGVLYAFFGPFALPRGTTVAEKKQKQEQGPLTVYQKLGLSEESMVLVYEAACLAVVLAASYTKSAKNVLLPPVVGGLLIGGAQAVSLILTRNTVGVSTGYEQVGQLAKWSWRRCSQGAKEAGAFPALKSLFFAWGIGLGSITLSRLVDIQVPGGEVNITPLAATIGGLVMVLGARIAGGCTSGHGISGMSTFGTASIISVASMFGGGIALASIL